MLRVVHIIKVTNIAGAETHLLTLLNGLKSRQVDVHLVMLVEPGRSMADYAEALDERGIPVEKLVIHADFDPVLLFRLGKTLRILQPQIVHTHLFHADLYGALAARWAIRDTALVTSRHNDNTFRRREPYRSLNRWLWQQTRAGIAISDSIARFVVEVEGAPPARLRTIHYGLDYVARNPSDRQSVKQSVRRELRLPDDALVVGMTCRLVEQKGVSYGLQAFVPVTARFPNAYLIIAGDGPLRQALENEAAALNLGERVRFLGWRDDVPQLMHAFDLLLAPSLWEGFGLVILEAMAGGLPVVASRVSAIPEIVVDGETGLLVPPRDTDALAEAITHLLNDAPLRRHMGMLGEDRLETHFSAGRMIDQTLNLYQELI